MYNHINTCIYIYIERERERETDTNGSKPEAQGPLGDRGPGRRVDAGR